MIPRETSREIFSQDDMVYGIGDYIRWQTSVDVYEADDEGNVTPVDINYAYGIVVEIIDVPWEQKPRLANAEPKILLKVYCCTEPVMKIQHLPVFSSDEQIDPQIEMVSASEVTDE